MSEGKKSDDVRTARNTLWYITFVGFAVNYMFRVNLNMTIVDMVQTKQTNNELSVSKECLISDKQIETIILLDEYEMLNGTNLTIANENIKYENDTGITITNKTRNINYSLERLLLTHFEAEVDERGFKWNEYQQGLVLGSFFWLHWVTQIPGGILAKRYGTKLVFGLSNLISCSLCFIMPICSYLDYRALILLRVLQGLISGLAWPAMHNMTAQWIPPNERSKFVTAYLGSSVGIALSFPFFGYIMSWSSWEWVFHISGIIGIIWYLVWQFLVYDSPAVHPRINPIEREFIEKSLGTSVQKDHVRTPWKEMLTDRSVWMVVIAQWGNIWGLFTYMTQAPTYFKYIHGWGIQMTGILSGLPHVMRMLFAYIFSFFGDYLLSTNKMSRSNVRKMAGFVCLIFNGFLSIALAYSGCHAIAAVVFLTLATATQGAVSTGPLANIVDISPNYASIIMGISGMVAVIPGFISPIIVGILTLDNQTITQWKYVFLISAAMLIVSGIIYVIFADANLKHWNNPKLIIKNDDDDEINVEPILINKTNLLYTSLSLNNDKEYNKDFKEIDTIILEENEEDLEETMLNDKNNQIKENSVLLLP